MSESSLAVGDRVKVKLEGSFWPEAGWYEGTVRRIDPYSGHRSFYWVELDVDVRLAGGGRTNMVSVLNPKHIVRL